MAQIFKKRYRTFIDCHGERVDPLHDYDVSTTYYVGDDGEEFDNVSQVVSEIVDNGKYDIPELPPVGTIVNIDELYQYNGEVYKVRQTHRVTIYNPADVLALFIIYRKETGTMEWIAGEKVDKGTLRTYGGTTYQCIQAHVTQEDWTPPAVPALWGVYVEPGGDEWAAGVAYTVGDVVTYDGSEYECRQSHTAQIGWEPPNVLALWLPL